LAKEVDVVSNVPPEYVQGVIDNPETSLYQNTALRMVWFGMNKHKVPLDDIEVRKAIQHAIDRNALVDYILGGLGAPATVICPPGVFGGLPQDEYGPDGKYPYNPETAMQILDDAGWIDTNGDGIRDKDGVNLEFEFTTPTGRYMKDVALAEAASEMLRQVGIQANVRNMETVAFFYTLPPGEYQMYELGFGFGSDVEPILRWILYKGTNPWAAWTPADDPVVDELMDKGKSEMDPEKRLEYYYEAQRRIMDDAIMMPIYYTKNIYGHFDYVKGFAVMPHELPVLDNCYIEMTG
jgi:peptide/nickel transport system substrate-binding protein